MLKSILFAILALALIFSSFSCTRLAPSGRKEKSFANYQFRLYNTNGTKANLYKRYVNNNTH
jgi:hypothetical protein